jgi:centrosomal protein CEP104
MAACPLIGPGTVASHGIASIPKSAWRPILGRLQLLADLVTAYGLGHKGGHDGTGLTVEAVMQFIKSNGAFAHSNGEVRDGAKDLVAAVQKYTGTDVLMPHLGDLRPKQLQEYLSAFVDYEGDGEGAPAPKPASKAAAPSQSKAAKQSNKAGGGTGAKVPTSAANPKSEAKNHSPPQKSHPNDKGKGGGGGGGLDAGAEDFTKCMFCGKSEEGWTEDMLDLHYWKDCPLLAPCPACAQIVEIAGLPEHLLEECEHKQNFESCDTTGLAIRREDFASWQESPSCVPPAENSMYCPLCLAAVVDSDDAWRQHLLYDCARNVRTYAV